MNICYVIYGLLNKLYVTFCSQCHRMSKASCYLIQELWQVLNYICRSTQRATTLYLCQYLNDTIRYIFNRLLSYFIQVLISL